jgi:hypothetical protein
VIVKKLTKAGVDVGLENIMESNAEATRGDDTNYVTLPPRLGRT